MPDTASNLQIRNACEGVLPLHAKIAPWMEQTLTQQPVQQWVGRWGSPLNVLQVEPFQQNLSELHRVGEQRDVDLRAFFARKANKCPAFITAAAAVDAGIDTASEVELTQTLDAGVESERVICTAAVKSEALLEQCVANDVVIAIDNADELRATDRVAARLRRSARVALRISGFQHDGEKLHSRFGVDIDEVSGFTDLFWPHPNTHPIRLVGLHFHLDGYSADQRVSAIQQSLQLVDRLRDRGHKIDFLDIGGGIPMRYLESESQWQDFWREHEAALLGKRSEVTYRNHPLARQLHDGRVQGAPNSYPYWQPLVQAEWMARVLDAEFEGATIAKAVARRDLQLRCEPGRSVLDGCGMTIARVEFRKRHPDGYWLIGLSMNRTQCRTSSDDFLVDPLLLPADTAPQERTAPMEGYLVGAYCTESELIQLRRMRFTKGVAIGDLIVFPNTAGYLMHFLESRSHQFPLAENLLVGDAGDAPRLV
ncbi:Y4yA family PLP-dependent enzyme [Roseimaritima ulvae]|uniref:Y4yA family PLP-dependent enzyme n=1 Tax=Roseimaritima ulvae TaxID=980254 RepID=UPI0036F25C65